MVSWGTIVGPYLIVVVIIIIITLQNTKSGVQAWLLLLKSRFLGMPTLEKFHSSHVFFVLTYPTTNPPVTN